MIGQFKGRQKTNVYGWVSDLAVARSGFNQIGSLQQAKAILFLIKEALWQTVKAAMNCRKHNTPFHQVLCTFREKHYILKIKKNL